MGKHGTELIHKFKPKILRLLKEQCKFIIYWHNTTTGCFISCKEKTPKEFQSSIVYKFSCPGCAKGYIGKTDRCLYTRLHKHATTGTKSEIYQHTNTFENFQCLTILLQLNTDEHNTEQFDMTSFLLPSSNLLFKEALAIRQQKPELKLPRSRSGIVHISVV